MDKKHIFFFWMKNNWKIDYFFTKKKRVPNFDLFVIFFHLIFNLNELVIEDMSCFVSFIVQNIGRNGVVGAVRSEGRIENFLDISSDSSDSIMAPSLSDIAFMFWCDGALRQRSRSSGQNSSHREEINSTFRDSLNNDLIIIIRDLLFMLYQRNLDSIIKQNRSQRQELSRGR